MTLGGNSNELISGLTQETNGECIIWGRKAKFVQVQTLGDLRHILSLFNFV